MVTLLPLEGHCTYSPSFFYTHFVVCDETKIRFWEDLWQRDQPLYSQFLGLFKVTTTRNLSISIILGNDTSLFWDLILHWNLIDVEIEDLERLMFLLSHVHLSPFVLYTKAWALSSLRVFLVKSFFLALSNFSDSIPFLLANFCGNQESFLRSWPSPGQWRIRR